jgi:hypothetical protein
MFHLRINLSIYIAECWQTDCARTYTQAVLYYDCATARLPPLINIEIIKLFISAQFRDKGASERRQWRRINNKSFHSRVSIEISRSMTPGWAGRARTHPSHAAAPAPFFCGFLFLWCSAAAGGASRQKSVHALSRTCSPAAASCPPRVIIQGRAHTLCEMGLKKVKLINIEKLCVANKANAPYVNLVAHPQRKKKRRRARFF